MYQIAICDDEKIFTDKLAHMIKQYSNAHHHVIDLHLFQQAADFIQSSLESYDIVFLDVRFGEISGIEIAKALRAKNENAILIFVSAFIEYAIMGYSVHASAYLLKSDLDGTFESCMDEIFPQIGSKEISVRVPYEHVNVDIPCKSIIYMESYKRQIQIHTSLPRYPSILYYAKLSDMIETLAPHGFLRIHKSYLINLSRCRRIQNRLAYMDNSTELPCSRQNYTDIVKNFFSGRSGKYNGTSNGDNDYWHRNILYCTFTQYIFRTKVYIIQIFLSALSCLSLLPLAALKHDTRHLIRHKTFYIHPHLACLFSNILYWSTSFSTLSLMFLFYHTFRT